MKLLILLLLVSCNPDQPGDIKEKLPKTTAVADVAADYYTISKYEDEDAICYVIAKTEAISISCVKVN